MRRYLVLFALLSLPAFAAPTPHATASDAKDLSPPPTISDSASDSTAAPEPEVRIIQKGQDKIEEYRLNGKLYMVKVTPSIGAPYYLVDDDGSGQMRQLGPNQHFIIPRWVLLRF